MGDHGRLTVHGTVLALQLRRRHTRLLFVGRTTGNASIYRSPFEMTFYFRQVCVEDVSSAPVGILKAIATTFCRRYDEDNSAFGWLYDEERTSTRIKPPTATGLLSSTV